MSERTGDDPAVDQPGADEQSEGAAAAARPTRRTAVLLGVAASGLLLGVTRLTWVDALAANLTGTAQALEVGGSDAAPAVVALAVVALAASLATSLSSSWVRFVTGPVLVLAGAGAGAAAFGPLRDPVSAASGTVAEATGVVGGAIEAEATLWPWLTVVPALLLVLVGAATVLVGGRWPRRSRYRSAAAAVAVDVDPQADPAAAWDALTRGEDPTEQTEPAEAAEASESAEAADRTGSGD